MQQTKLNIPARLHSDSRILATRSNDCNTSHSEKALTATTQVLVVFEFPDNSVSEHQFLAGQTVEVLKAHLESEFGMEMTRLTLTRVFDGKALLDPVSIVDYMHSISPTAGRHKTDSVLRVDVEIDDGGNWLQGESKHK